MSKTIHDKLEKVVECELGDYAGNGCSGIIVVAELDKSYVPGKDTYYNLFMRIEGRSGSKDKLIELPHRIKAELDTSRFKFYMFSIDDDDIGRSDDCDLSNKLSNYARNHVQEKIINNVRKLAVNDDEFQIRLIDIVNTA